MSNQVDVEAIEGLADEIQEANRIALGQLVLRGEDLVKQEVPKITHRLESGVSSNLDYEKLEGIITISARSEARGARTGKFVGINGETRDVKLKPVRSFNYAEVVARGNKAGPFKRKALLIPVKQIPTEGGYIKDGDEIYVVRMSRKRIKANPYHERAANRLQDESAGIVSGVLEDYFQ